MLSKSIKIEEAIAGKVSVLATGNSKRCAELNAIGEEILDRLEAEGQL